MSEDGDDDDEDLWLEIAKTVKPLPGKKPLAIIPKKMVRARIKIEVPEKTFTAPKVTASPLPQKRVRKLKQQKIPVEAKLDLHGMTVEKAHIAVTGFIRNAVHNELRCVEIVTGRGSPERGTGQLKRMLPLWLQDGGIRPFILHIDENPASRGGSYLVLLRRARG